MTPKEKAEELIKNFGKVDILIEQEPSNIDCRIEDTHWKGTAEVCALIAVNEILKCHIWKFNSIEPYNYWQEVKKEIEKL